MSALGPGSTCRELGRRAPRTPRFRSQDAHGTRVMPLGHAGKGPLLGLCSLHLSRGSCFVHPSCDPNVANLSNKPDAVCEAKLRGKPGSRPTAPEAEG